MSPADRSRATRNADWLAPPDEQEGLRRYVATLRERLPLILAITALTTAAAIAYVLLAPKTYEAESQVLVNPVSDPALEGLGLIGASSDPTRDVQTASLLITTNAVAERVAEKVGFDGDPSELLDEVKAEPLTQSQVVAITASGSDPEQAAELADAFAEEAVKERTASLHKSIDQQLPTISKGDPLRARFERLRENPDPTIRVATAADVPTGPVSPKPKLSVAAGILAGLVLGVAAAFAFQVLDPRLRREEQLRARFRVPIIGRVPKESNRRGDQPLGPNSLSPAVAEAYRTLRGTISATKRSADGKTLLVTGSSPSEGKTTTAINLAASLSAAGKRVILIEADLRRPAISRALGVEPSRGVVGVLIESMSIEEALIDAESIGLPNLYLLLAENQGGWISELFSLPTAIEMLERARSLADYVIIDSPPLTDVVDALPLARAADDVLVVVRPGTTRLSKLVQLGELLAGNGIRPLGFTVVGAPRPGREESSYYFDRSAIPGARGAEGVGGPRSAS